MGNIGLQGTTVMKRTSWSIITNLAHGLIVCVLLTAGCAGPESRSGTQGQSRDPQAQKPAQKDLDEEPNPAAPVVVPDEISPEAVADDFDKAHFVEYRGKTVTWRGKVDTESDPEADFVVVVLSDKGADGAPCKYVAAVKMFSPLSSVPPKGKQVMIRGLVEDIFTEAWWPQGDNPPGRILNRPENNDLPPVMKGTDGKVHRTVCFRLCDGRLALTK